jgi:hypothetical protein
MMWTGADFIIALVILAVILGIITLIVRAFYPNRVIPDEREDFDDYRDTPEARFRKADSE